MHNWVAKTTGVLNPLRYSEVACASQSAIVKDPLYRLSTRPTFGGRKCLNASAADRSKTPAQGTCPESFHPASFGYSWAGPEDLQRPATAHSR